MKACLFVLLISYPALAGLVVSGNLTQGGTTSSLRQIYQGDNARLEYKASPGSQQDNWLVYRGGTGMISVVDTVKKSFLELHENDVQKIGGIISAFPGAKKAGAKTKPGDLTFKKAGEQKVSDWKCTKYTVLNKGKKSGEMCVVPFDRIGAAQTDFKPLASLAKTFSTLGSIAPQESAFLGWGIDQALNLGFMVETIGYDASGKPLSKLTIDSVKKESVSDSAFSNPAGFTKTDLTGLLQNLMMGKPPTGR